MLFVHFTPKKNVSDIKRNGISPAKGSRFVFLFPLLHDEKTLVNQWDRPDLWRTGTARHDRPSAKIIVRLPAFTRVSLGDWIESQGAKGKQDLLLFTVSELGPILAGMLRNPYSNAAIPRGGRPEDRTLLIAFARWCKQHGVYYRSPGMSVLQILEDWLKGRIWQENEAFKPQSHGIDLWGSEIVYPGRIPRHWIVRILDRSNTDQASRSYSRERKSFDYE